MYVGGPSSFLLWLTFFIASCCQLNRVVNRNKRIYMSLLFLLQVFSVYPIEIWMCPATLALRTR